MKRYINLNTHSSSSFRETVVTPEEKAEFAVKDSAKAIALTDLNSVKGLPEFSKAAEKYSGIGMGLFRFLFSLLFHRVSVII